MQLAARLEVSETTVDNRLDGRAGEGGAAHLGHCRREAAVMLAEVPVEGEVLPVYLKKTLQRISYPAKTVIIWVYGFSTRLHWGQ